MKHKINVLLFALSITVICLFFYESAWFITLLISFTALFLLIISLGVLFMKLNYFLKSVNKLENDFVLLTFDDGPDPEKTPAILDILSKHNIKAIFFMIGNRAEKAPELLQRIIAEGHLIGNHSYGHNNFMSLFTTKKLRAEIKKGQEVLEKLSNRKIPFFRPPIGYTNPTYARVLKEFKLMNFGWSLRSYDSVYTAPEKLIERLNSQVKHGDIILLHDNLKVTLEALDGFITSAKANGINFANGETIKTMKYA